MKNRYLLVPAIGLVATTPAMAQSNSVNNAVKGTMTQTPISPPPHPNVVTIPPPAPPPVVIERPREKAPPPPVMLVPAPPAPPGPRYPRDPRVANYRDARPTQADYPLTSWQNDEQGTVRYAVDVDADGNATDCTITQSSGFSALDEKTCQVVMERAEWLPAMEDEDTAIAGRAERSFRWRKREPELPQLSVIVQYTHDERGQTTDCKVIRMEGDLPERMRRDFERNLENGRACPIGRGGRGVPYRDENGVPVSRQVTVTFDVQVEEPDE